MKALVRVLFFYDCNEFITMVVAVKSEAHPPPNPTPDYATHLSATALNPPPAALDTPVTPGRCWQKFFTAFYLYSNFTILEARSRNDRPFFTPSDSEVLLRISVLFYSKSTIPVFGKFYLILHLHSKIIFFCDF